jgi:DNA-binding PadR family transcriptional regulator
MGRTNIQAPPLWICILAIFASGHSAGYEIKFELNKRFSISTSFGSIYPTIHILENKGLIALCEAEQSRGKKVYSITSKGLTKMKECNRYYESILETFKALAPDSSTWLPDEHMIAEGAQKPLQVVHLG